METLTGTVGIGWDFPIARELVLRPIANFTLGRMTSDVSAATQVIENAKGKEIQLRENGSLNALGLGLSLMLDYEHYRQNYEIDVELRFTNMYLQSLPARRRESRGHFFPRI